MTDGKTKLVGLMGWPVEHSLSPAMHNSAFSTLGLNWHYVPLPVRPGQVGSAVSGLQALGFCGANVTTPHKLTVMSCLNQVNATAASVGAVNTLVIRQQHDGAACIEGHNTDISGFLGALRTGEYEPADGRRAVVIGAGGGARAVVLGLLSEGMRNIVILNRSPERSKALVADVGMGQGFVSHVTSFELNLDTLIESARQADLLVNATSVGMWPAVAASIWPENIPLPAHLTVFDLVYNPLETRLLRHARRSGAHPIDGLGMLTRQGAIAFEMWTGLGPVDEIAGLMRAVCEKALQDSQKD